MSLAGATHPVGALGNARDSALARVRRLAKPARPLSSEASVLATTAALSVMALPMVIAVAPAVAAAAVDYCPVGFPV